SRHWLQATYTLDARQGSIPWWPSGTSEAGTLEGSGRSRCVDLQAVASDKSLFCKEWIEQESSACLFQPVVLVTASLTHAHRKLTVTRIRLSRRSYCVRKPSPTSAT